MGIFSWLKKIAENSPPEQRCEISKEDHRLMDSLNPYADVIKNGKATETKRTDLPPVDFESRYDLSSLRQYKLGSDSGFLLDGKNRSVAQEDLLEFNPFLAEGKNIFPQMPLFQINRTNVCFQSEKPWEGSYTTLSLTPLTRTGKQPKYPLFLHFFLQSQDEHWKIMENDGQEIFGHVGYLKDGTIGKADIVCWNFINRHDECYYFHIRRKGTELYLSKVENTTAYQQEES